jgi:thymidylate synthase (FAD)
MKLIKPSFSIEPFNSKEMLKNIEKAGRTCYKSENKITENSAKDFVRKIIKSGHETVIEHEKITARVVCDRGVSHEIVRHRIASYSQESTRYCDYSGGVVFIIPPWLDESVKEGEYKKYEASPDEATNDWLNVMWNTENIYKELLKKGWSPQQARSVLPNSTKTEIVITMNLREWRHFFKLRTPKTAHPQMVEIAAPMKNAFSKLLPVVFDD